MSHMGDGTAFDMVWHDSPVNMVSGVYHDSGGNHRHFEYRIRQGDNTFLRWNGRTFASIDRREMGLAEEMAISAASAFAVTAVGGNPMAGIDDLDFDPMPTGGGQVPISGMFAGVAVLALLRSAGIAISRGAVVRWSSLPSWVRTGLLALGVVEGADILIDTGEGDSGLLPVPIMGGGPIALGDPTAAMVNAMTVSTWRAGSVTFHRLSDGRLAVQNKHGVWKIWRPKKPVVLFSTGNKDLQSILRADAIIQKEAKKLARLLRNRGHSVRRKTDS